MTVWIYKRGDEIKVFTTAEAAQAWFDKNDPEGVAFEYPVEELALPQIPVDGWGSARH
jgi:hypothetical protein